VHRSCREKPVAAILALHPFERFVSVISVLEGRHSLATNLKSLGVDIKVAQELMRHSSCRTTLDVYTRAVDQQKREASLKVVSLMLPPLDVEKFQHPSAPSGTHKATRRCRQIAVKEGLSGGPDRDRTDDLFHAMEPIKP
jgi:hypothetical protein